MRTLDIFAPFTRRLAELPVLGLGISTEFGAAKTGLDPLRFAKEHPQLVHFLEVGADLERGVDATTLDWVASGRPATYHFLDVNLEEPEDLDDEWIRSTVQAAQSLNAAWLCGDAGLWHIGPRDRGHGVLLPPILNRDSARELARGVVILREQTGMEVLPENPPASCFVGDMHLLDYFAEVIQSADCGVLLDVAHLAIFQHVRGFRPLDGLANFPLDRILEVHVAGGRTFEFEGRTYIDDDHGPNVLDSTWEIFDYVAQHAPNLRAVVCEGERNSAELIMPVFRRLHDTWCRR